jgi:hypothetical protein
LEQLPDVLVAVMRGVVFMADRAEKLFEATRHELRQVSGSAWRYRFVAVAHPDGEMDEFTGLKRNTPAFELDGQFSIEDEKGLFLPMMCVRRWPVLFCGLDFEQGVRCGAVKQAVGVAQHPKN